jgi:trans-2,3-dihydro-3-hydroxyanthranilate isomerase
VSGGQVERVVMTQDRPAFRPVLEDVTGLAAALGLAPEAISDTGLPVQPVSTGVDQLVVPVRSLAEVQGLNPAHLDAAAISRTCRSVGAEEAALVFALETERAEADVHVRFFAPAYGIPEDPATGSANGVLGAYLVRHRAVPVSEPTTYIVSEQGMEMGRPSALNIEVDSVDGEPTAVRVGGQVVPLIEGTVRF